jgi:hypothetical protein
MGERACAQLLPHLVEHALHTRTVTGSFSIGAESRKSFELQRAQPAYVSYRCNTTLRGLLDDMSCVLRLPR